MEPYVVPLAESVSVGSFRLVHLSRDGRIPADKLGPLGFRLEASATDLLEDGILAYRMLKSPADGTFDRFEVLPAASPDGASLRAAILDRPGSVAGPGGITTLRDADFFRCAFRSGPPSTEKWYVLVSRKDGTPEHPMAGFQSRREVLVYHTGLPMDASGRLMRVISPNVPGTTDPCVLAYDEGAGEYVLNPGGGAPFQVRPANQDYALVCYMKPSTDDDENPVAVPVRLTSSGLPRNPGMDAAAVVPVLTAGHRLVPRKVGDAMVLEVPAPPTVVAVGGRDYLFRYPVFDIMSSSEKSATVPEMIARYFAHVITRTRAVDPDLVSITESIFSNVRQLQSQFATSLTNAVLGSLLQASSSLAEFLGRALEARGPAPFNFSEVPSSYQMGGETLAFAFDLTLACGDNVYTLRDLFLVLALSSL
jgi:hypothetical protein